MSCAGEFEDAQVLFGLGHPTLVGVHDEDRAVNAADPGQHVVDETNVTRNVDERHLTSGREREVREPEIDGHSAFALFAPAVGVGAGESGDERRLAVVDVTRGREDPHREASACRSASTTT